MWTTTLSSHGTQSTLAFVQPEGRASIAGLRHPDKVLLMLDGGRQGTDGVWTKAVTLPDGKQADQLSDRRNKRSGFPISRLRLLARLRLRCSYGLGVQNLEPARRSTSWCDGVLPPHFNPPVSRPLEQRRLLSCSVKPRRSYSVEPATLFHSSSTGSDTGGLGRRVAIAR
jgi:hypothetical protein